MFVLSASPIPSLEPLFDLFRWLGVLVVVLGSLKILRIVLDRKGKRARGRSPRPEEREGRKTRDRSSTSDDFSFRLKTKVYFFSRAEEAFYPKLVEAITDLQLLVFPKVGLCDIFVDKKDAERGQYGRYSQMHVDYLLVRSTDYTPVAGIELNGPSHQEEEQQANDRKKKAVFAAAGLPLLTFYNQPSFSTWEIQSRLQDVLGPVSP